MKWRARNLGTNTAAVTDDGSAMTAELLANGVRAPDRPSSQTGPDDGAASNPGVSALA